jgi:hypothetical protein
MENPKEIVTISGISVASFDYYSGIEYAKSKKLTQTSDMNEIMFLERFIVCCGDVMVRVMDKDFPEIERRSLD